MRASDGLTTFLFVNSYISQLDTTARAFHVGPGAFKRLRVNKDGKMENENGTQHKKEEQERRIKVVLTVLIKEKKKRKEKPTN